MALPAAVRARVVALAADRLQVLPEDQVPAAVRPFRRFAPQRRAKAAAVPLATALEQDPAFRQLVAEGVAAELADSLRAGTVPAAAPPEEVAAAAYLLRPDGWQDVVRRAADELAESARLAAGAATVDEVQRLIEQLAALRAHGRAEAERLGGELQASRDQVVALTRKVRDLGARAAAAERALAAAGPAPEPDGDDPVPEAGEADGEQEGSGDAAEVRRLRARLRAAEQALTAARTGQRGERREDQVRLRVLLEAIVGAAGGLQRELALPPLDERPADAVAASYAPATVPATAAPQGRADDDPALLDALLAVRSTHLLVDGYNVTKTGYGEQTLEAQRSRLLAGLGGLAARTGAEVTVVFDGAGLDGRVPAGHAPRGVRLLFSPAGSTADDVLRDLVRAEPTGRPLVVVSSDREVADDTRRAGARTVASRALLSLLERGSVGPRS